MLRLGSILIELLSRTFGYNGLSRGPFSEWFLYLLSLNLMIFIDFDLEIGLSLTFSAPNIGTYLFVDAP
jgi:hypothetical protein